MLEQSISYQLNSSQAMPQVPSTLEPTAGNLSLAGSRFRRLNYVSHKRQPIDNTRTIDVSSFGLNTQDFNSN